MAPDDSVDDLRARHEQLLAERDDYYSGTARRGEIAGWVARRLEATVFAGGALEECDEGSDRGLVEIWADLAELYCEFDERYSDDPEYQTRIVSLLTAFEYPIPTRIVASIVGCSRGYARRFYWDDDEMSVREKEWSKRQRSEQAPPKLVAQVLERDRGRCVRCKDDIELVAHHVVPVTQGGRAESANLITLCKSCHEDAHGGALCKGSVVYASNRSFEQWLGGLENE